MGVIVPIILTRWLGGGSVRLHNILAAYSKWNHDECYGNKLLFT